MEITQDILTETRTKIPDDLRGKIPNEIFVIYHSKKDDFFRGKEREIEDELNTKKTEAIDRYLLGYIDTELNGRVASSQIGIVDDFIDQIEQEIIDIGKYSHSFRNACNNKRKELEKQVDDYIKYISENNKQVDSNIMQQLKRNLSDCDFLIYLSTYEKQGKKYIKEELIKLKEQIRTGKIELEEKGKPTEIPENLNELLSIWHDKNDIENLIIIYNNHKIHFENKDPQKTLMSCFAYTLYENKWLIKLDSQNFNSKEVAKIFFKIFEWECKPKDSGLFNIVNEKPLFDLKYTRKMKIPLREA